jgi:hypothetical protein
MRTENLFECPSCGGHRLEELVCATRSSVIDKIDESGEIEYGDVSSDKDVIYGFRCVNCGWVVPDGIVDYEVLWDYLNDPRRACKPGCFKQPKKKGGRHRGA